jgi:hypothetical protein
MVAKVMVIAWIQKIAKFFVNGRRRWKHGAPTAIAISKCLGAWLGLNQSWTQRRKASSWKIDFMRFEEAQLLFEAERELERLKESTKSRPAIRAGIERAAKLVTQAIAWEDGGPCHGNTDD